MTLLAAFAFSAVALAPVESTTLAPFEEVFALGVPVKGNLVSWAADDNDARAVRLLFEHPLYPRVYCRVHLTYRVPEGFQPADLKFKVKIAGNTPGHQWMSLKFRDVLDNTWIPTNIDRVFFEDKTEYVANMPGDISRWTGTDGTVQCLIDVGRLGPVAVYPPQVGFEFANLVATR